MAKFICTVCGYHKGDPVDPIQPVDPEDEIIIPGADGELIIEPWMKENDELNRKVNIYKNDQRTAKYI